MKGPRDFLVVAHDVAVLLLLFYNVYLHVMNEVIVRVSIFFPCCYILKYTIYSPPSPPSEISALTAS